MGPICPEELGRKIVTSTDSTNLASGIGWVFSIKSDGVLPADVCAAQNASNAAAAAAAAASGEQLGCDDDYFKLLAGAGGGGNRSNSTGGSYYDYYANYLAMADLSDDPAAALNDTLPYGFRRASTSGGTQNAFRGCVVASKQVRTGAAALVCQPGRFFSQPIPTPHV